MKKKIFLYLASQSPRRKEILKKMRIPFRVVQSSYQEKMSRVAPQKLVMDHAIGKALGAQWGDGGKGLVLGADTIVYCRGKILGKPKNLPAAYKMLRSISGKMHAVYTGIALKDLSSGRVYSGYAKTRVYIEKLSEKEIQDYCKKVPPLDKAGAYAIQMKPKIVSKISGSYSNVVGLPEELLRKLIRKSCAKG